MPKIVFIVTELWSKLNISYGLEACCFGWLIGACEGVGGIIGAGGVEVDDDPENDGIEGIEGIDGTWLLTFFKRPST